MNSFHFESVCSFLFQELFIRTYLLFGFSLFSSQRSRKMRTPLIYHALSLLSRTFFAIRKFSFCSRGFASSLLRECNTYSITSSLFCQYLFWLGRKYFLHFLHLFYGLETQPPQGLSPRFTDFQARLCISYHIVLLKTSLNLRQLNQKCPRKTRTFLVWIKITVILFDTHHARFLR